MISYKKDFPIFDYHAVNFHYLDSAATSQKPRFVINTITEFYKKSLAPVHRSAYFLAEDTTKKFEKSRKRIQHFLHAQSEHEIIFTKNTNEAFNIIVKGQRDFLTDRDVVVLSKMEHHANIVPWLKLQQEIKFTIKWLDINNEGRLMWELIEDWPLKIKDNIKIVSLTHASNVLGTINPIREIIRFIKEELPDNDLTFIVDGAQAIPHMEVDVQVLDCDYYVFSGHKILAPSGVGVLYGRKELLHTLQPLNHGSHMITWVTTEDFQIHADEQGFEAGTPNIEGVIGLEAAIHYISAIGMGNIMSKEEELTTYALNKFRSLSDITLYGPTTIENRLGIFSFNINGIHPHDVAYLLGEKGVCVRAGHHCAMPLMPRIAPKQLSCVRASLYLYNDKSDIDALIEGIKEVKKTFKR